MQTVEILPSTLTDLLARQHQIASRRQLLAAGITDMEMYRRTRRGEWQRPVGGVYAISRDSLSTEQRRIVAALYAGENAQITGLPALHWYGYRYAPATDKMHVLVPHDTRRRSSGFVLVQRALVLDPHARHGELYDVVSPARAVVDASRLSGDLRATRAIMAEAVYSRYVPLADIVHEIRRAGRSRTAVASRVVAELTEGVRSSPEAELRELLATNPDLPTILWNPRLVGADGATLPTPDAFIVDAGLALEVDSRDHHADGEAWLRTLARSNALQGCGAAVLHFTPTEIRTEPARVKRAVEQTCALRIAGGASASLRLSVVVASGDSC